MSRLNQAIFWGLAAQIGFGIMAVLVKNSIQMFSIWQIIFIRSFFSITIILFLSNNKILLLGQNKKLLIIRGLLGFGAISLSFFALRYLTLINASAIFQTSPIFVFIFSHIFLKEKVSILEWVLLFIAFFGVFLVLRPNLGLLTWPALAALSGAAMAGVAHTILRGIRKTDTAKTVVFYYSFLSTLISLPLAFCTWVNIPTIKHLIMLLGIGFFATLSQLAMTKAYSLAPARKIAIIKYISIPLAGILGYCFWSEIPNAWTVIGSLFIIFAILSIESIGMKIWKKT